MNAPPDSSTRGRETPRDPETYMFVSKLSPQIIHTVADALRAGAPPEMASSYAGIARSTYHEWLKRGRTEIAEANGNLAEVLAESLHAQFAAAVENALANFVVGNMTTIGLHGRQDRAGDWRPLAWQLERRFPGLFGKTTRHELSATVQHEHFIAVDPAKLDLLTLEEKLQLAELLGKLGGEVIDHEGPPLELEP